MTTRSRWVPDRRDIIWIDCNPHAGSQMRDVHQMLVLSPSPFNDRTGLIIGLPMTTAAYNATNPFAIAVGKTSGRKGNAVSYVLCHQPKSFDWRARHARAHPLGRMPPHSFADCCALLNQIISVA